MHSTLQRRALVVATSAVIAAGACGRRPPTQPAIETFATTHFSVEVPAADLPGARTIVGRVESQHARITSDLGVGDMPRVRVTFYTTHAEMAAAVHPVVGHIPAWVTGLVTAVDRIHALVPSAAGGVDPLTTTVLHEFVHAVSLQRQPAFGNHPRWWWESVALFEADQRVDPRSLPYLIAGQPPAFADLDRPEDTRVYDVGYTIAEFVRDEFGRDALRALVSTLGDTERAMGLPLADFEQRWFAFVRTRYLF